MYKKQPILYFFKSNMCFYNLCCLPLFQTQLVEMDFATNIKQLKDNRDITIIHGMIRGVFGSGDDEDELSLIDENPIIVLMEFGHMNGFRLTDLFSVFDKDGSKSLDKSEIKTGLMVR